jgi:DNA polymerase-3 subunit alpha (Gram-positive type)
MALNPQEQFQVLLQQLQYKEVPDTFKEATLTKLTVHKQSRVWQFHLSLPELPEVTTLAMLISKLQTTFASIATVNYEISLTVQPKLPQIINYWGWVLNQHQNEPGAFQRAFNQVMPVIDNEQLVLNFASTAWSKYATQTGLPIIQNAC